MLMEASTLASGQMDSETGMEPIYTRMEDNLSALGQKTKRSSGKKFMPMETLTKDLLKWIKLNKTREAMTELTNGRTEKHTKVNG